MKQITKCLTIDNKDYYLIQIEKSDLKEINQYTEECINAYGTIPYEYVNDKGVLIKGLALGELCYGRTIEQAIERRHDMNMIDKLTEGVEDDMEVCKIIANYFKAKKGDK